MLLFKTFLVLVISNLAQCSFFNTCQDLAKKNYKESNGTRVFKPPRSDVAEHVVFCQFLSGYGYTFIPTTIFTGTDIYRYDADLSDFKVVFLHKNGSQSETLISPGNDGGSIGAQYVNKKSPDVEDLVINKDMYPYVTYTMTNENITDKDSPLSYAANGQIVTSSVCNEEQNGDSGMFVWSFLFNRNNKTPMDDNNGQSGTESLSSWIKSGIPSTVSLPRNFFAFFEMRYTSCDDHVTGSDFEDIVGAAIGIKFVVECPEPEQLWSGYYSVTGYRFMDNLTYFCNPGFEIFDEEILTCNEKGKWIGDKPYCKEIKPRSCSDVLTQFGATLPGEYIIYTKHNTPNIVYCEFREDHVITFIHPKGLLGVKIGALYNDKSNIVVRARYPDGRQVESVLGQIQANKDVPIKVSLSYSETLLARFQTPIDKQDRHSLGNVTIGYNVNGVDVDVTLQWCCYDPTEAAVSFVAFLGDSAKSYNDKGPKVPLIKTKWLTEAKPIPGEMYMPEAFYSDFSLQAGFDSSYGLPVPVAGIAVGVISNL